MSGGGSNDRLRTPESLPDEAAVGEVDYEALSVGEVVGRGGNAVVREATLPGDDGQVVALKEPHAAGAVPAVVVERFRREAATWTDLDDHPHVVTVHDWGTDPHPWLALEFMDAGSLADRAGDVGLAEGLWTGARVASALAHAHREGVAHRDLTPDNVLLEAAPGDGWAVPGVADWGLARALRPEAANLEGLTPRYAAPEQFAPERFGAPGAATDVYGLGVVLYELLVGAPPFDGPPRALRDAIVEETPPPASGRNPQLPAAVDDILDRALAKEPGDRHGSMAALRRDIEALLAERTAYEPGEGDVPTGDDAPSGGATPIVDDPPTGDGTQAGGDAAADAAPATPSDAATPYDRALPLAGEGFVRLTEGYFARREPAPPLAAWRRGVTLADARAGRAVERTVPDEDGGAERVPLGERLLDGLAGGTDHVVLGPPGSGKSTVCKRVACEWFDRGHGPVFYRESGRGERFEAPDALARQVSDADGHALVVVEDAVRPAANAVFELLDRVRDLDDVTVLLDARESEWREADPGADPFGTDPVARGREALEPVYVPRPDREEHERFVRAVEAAADRSLDVDLEQLRADVERAAADGTGDDGSRPGELLHLLHRLTALAGDPLADGEPTTLTDAVADAHDRLAELGDDALDVGVCANVLNAAGVGVHPELLYAVVPDDPLAVDAAVDVLEGRAVFPRETDWGEGTTAYPAAHEAWSTAFLEHLLEVAGETEAAERFGRVVSRVLELAEDPARRERIDDALGGAAPYLARIERDPGAWAEETVASVYGLGRKRPKLAPLFGDGERDSVDLPAACSGAVAEEWPARLGRMFMNGGYYDRAQRAYERLPAEGDRGVERLIGLTTVAENRGELDDAVAYGERCLERIEEPDEDRPDARARVRLHLGRALSNRGEFDAADRHLRAALERFEAVDDRRRTAKTLDSIGIMAALQNEYDRAGEHLERSLDISRRLDDRRAVANTLNNLGEIARHQGRYDRAREHQERSLELRRELGDRRGEASSLNNLGIVAKRAGAFDRASEYLEESLAIKQELGDRKGVVSTTVNLGDLLRLLGEYDRAHEYLQQGLETAREIGLLRGEIGALSNLGELDRHRGRYDRARERHAEAIETAREIKYPYGEALNLANLAEVIRVEGEYERARERLERALDLAEEIGEPEAIALTHYRLGKVDADEGRYGSARGRFERALDAVGDGERPRQAARIQLSRARLALSLDDHESARERATAARERLAEVGATHWAARSRRLLGRVAVEAGEPGTARAHWRAALETFEDVGAPQDALATLEHLVEACREADDHAAARRWCERARNLLADAPDPAVDRHGGWVDRECSGGDP